jgi:6,7-dimethyl-8-ribityllumazine synthase
MRKGIIFMQIEGSLNGQGLRIAVIASRFNDLLTKNLMDGAMDALKRHGVENADTFLVPGAFEIPLIAENAASSGRYDAVIALGALIRGATPHFEYLSASVTKSIAEINMKHGVPVIFGLITADTLEQAIERSGTKQGNKGFTAAENAIEMATLIRETKKVFEQR